MKNEKGIIIRIVTDYNQFSDLIIAFAKDFWSNKNAISITSLPKNGIDDFDNIAFPNFESIKPTLDLRENMCLTNYLSFWINEYKETMIVSSDRKQTQHKEYPAYFELTFTPQNGKKLGNASQHIDYGFYLNQIIPRLENLKCNIREIKYIDTSAQPQQYKMEDIFELYV